MKIDLKKCDNKEIVEFYDSIEDGKAHYRGGVYTVGDVNDPLFQLMSVKLLQERMSKLTRKDADYAELTRILRMVAIDKFESHNLSFFIVLNTYRLSEKEVKVEMLKVLKQRHNLLFYGPTVDFLDVNAESREEELGIVADSLTMEKLTDAMNELAPDGYLFKFLDNVKPSVYLGYVDKSRQDSLEFEFINW